VTQTFEKISEAPPEKGTYAFVSLGCPKNTVDSERMMGLLQLDGYRLVRDPQGTDFVVVNTCGFIEPSRLPRSTRCSVSNGLQTRGVIVSVWRAAKVA
jgi:ribosomal protein S12 methylthiotransferase